MTAFTTLNSIREKRPCLDGWEKLLKHLGKTKPDDEPVPLTTVLDSNGVMDAIWCLRTLEGQDKEIRLFAVACAREAQHLMTDPRSIDALDVATRFAQGQASAEELVEARSAAYAAAAARAADVAAAAAAYAAACAAAYAAAAYAARAAAAADVADAAAYAAYAAANAANAAHAADAAAKAAARAKQAEIFRRIFG